MRPKTVFSPITRSICKHLIIYIIIIAGLRISQTCKKRGESEKLTLQMATEMYNNSGKDVRIIGNIIFYIYL
jgi:hypothetical protein